MTVKEFAEIVKKHISTVYRWIKNGKIKATKRGRRWFIESKKNKDNRVLIDDLLDDLGRQGHHWKRSSVFYAAEDLGIKIKYFMDYVNSSKYKNQVHWVTEKQAKKIEEHLKKNYV